MDLLKKLYHRGRTGSIYEWSTWTDGPIVYTKYGQVDGAMQTSSSIAEGKNIGKTNETSPERQAEIESLSLWNFKRERKYRETIEEAMERRIAPMLAPSKGWKDTKRYGKYPADLQPKLDGARSLAYWEDGKVVLLSRGLKKWNLPHISEQLAKILPPAAMFDGELYFHGVNRQTIQKWISKTRPESAKIEYHIYDIPVSDDGEEKLWEERRLDLDRLVPGEPMKGHPDTPNIVKVMTLEVHNEDEVMSFQTACIEAGFEGAMFRNRKGKYDSGNRSSDLLKIKTFDDDEFLVVGYKDGSGKNVGVVTWKCKINTPCSKNCDYYCDYCTFDCDPLGSYPDRAKWFLAGDSYVGKWMTVKFQGFSDDKIPQFVKGVAFRLDQDK